MNHLFIVNTNAGNNNFNQFTKLISTLKSKYNLYIEISNNKAEIDIIINKYIKLDNLRVYAVGGDGTLNILLNSLIKYDIPIGLIPLGTGNDFAHYIYGEKKWDINKNIESLLNGKEKLIDLGSVNEKYFINIASLGFDVKVAKEANKLKKYNWFPKFLAYYFSIFKTLYKKESLHYNILIDGKDYSDKYLLVVIANGKYYGRGITPSPEAIADDGYFDICLINSVTRFKIIQLLPLYKSGKHTELNVVKIVKGKKIEVIQNSEMPLNLDGDTYIVKNCEFKILHNKIRFLIPEINFNNT